MIGANEARAARHEKSQVIERLLVKRGFVHFV